MITKTINYTDFNCEKQTETACFHMSKRELMKLAFEMPDMGVDEDDLKGKNPDDLDVEAVGAKMLETVGPAGLIDFIEKLVLRSYGVKSEDGRRFIKSDELTAEFAQTPAYDEFIMELLNNEQAQAEFISKVIPAEELKQAAAPKKLPNKKGSK